ncbi:MAG: DNA polymerase III subunit gamma/tau [Planctomycetes bacterium]|nr:DNA polymerase III subunit gamma/tau [Planctomycetota bacterium]
MSYQVLARKYRPQQFDEVSGQEAVATTLKNAIQFNRVAHAYLFCGPRGVGKTSMARILSKALNCVKGPTLEPCGACDICKRITSGDDLDVLELDGASNRGIDEVRQIRDNVRYTSSRARFKIYIIDEVHMLTKEAFNALLKTLEEPPPHVKFIFATTEVHRIPETILSRCQRFDFKRITNADIVKRLGQICRAEGIEASGDVLHAVARAARGAMRDSQSLLDKLISFGHQRLTIEALREIQGISSFEEVADFVDRLADRKAAEALVALDRLFEQGKDMGEFLGQLIDHARLLMLLQVGGPDSPLLEVTREELERLQKQASRFSLDSLIYMIQLLGESRRHIRDGGNVRIPLEVAIVKIASMEDLKPVSEVLRRLAEFEQALEARGGFGASQAIAASPAPPAAAGPGRRPARPDAGGPSQSPGPGGVTSKPAISRAGSPSPEATGAPRGPETAQAVPGRPPLPPVRPPDAGPATGPASGQARGEAESTVGSRTALAESAVDAEHPGGADATAAGPAASPAMASLATAVAVTPETPPSNGDLMETWPKVVSELLSADHLLGRQLQSARLLPSASGRVLLGFRREDSFHRNSVGVPPKRRLIEDRLKALTGRTWKIETVEISDSGGAERGASTPAAPSTDSGPATRSGPAAPSTPSADPGPAAPSAPSTDSGPATRSGPAAPSTDSGPAAPSAPSTDPGPAAPSTPSADSGHSTRSGHSVRAASPARPGPAARGPGSSAAETGIGQGSPEAEAALPSAKELAENPVLRKALEVFEARLVDLRPGRAGHDHDSPAR